MQQMDAARVGTGDDMEPGRVSSSSGCGSGAPGAPTASTAPSINGGSPRVQRWTSSHWSPAYSTGAPEPEEEPDPPSPPDTAETSAAATAARAVPAGAVTTTWPRAGRAGPAGLRRSAGSASPGAVPSARAPRHRGRSGPAVPTADFPTTTRARTASTAGILAPDTGDMPAPGVK
ncbi:hypothetical protein ACR6C2_18880 [Streptomyces sp. INA 01156]